MRRHEFIPHVYIAEKGEKLPPGTWTGWYVTALDGSEILARIANEDLRVSRVVYEFKVTSALYIYNPSEDLELHKRCPPAFIDGFEVCP